MFFTIYKITNKINNKYYIGMHQTENINDGYMGSGKLIRKAIEKYGLENFNKDILYIFNNEEDMKNKEKELVVVSEQTYNLCDGGHGGFGYINSNGLKNSKKQRSTAKENILKLNSTKTKEQHHIAAMKAAKKRKENGTQYCGSTNHMNTVESIEKRKQTFALVGHQRGEKNSQYGIPRSEETKRKISESLKKRKLNNT